MDRTESFISIANNWQWVQVQKLAKKSPNLARLVCPIPVAITTIFLHLLVAPVTLVSETTELRGRISLLKVLKYLGLIAISPLTALATSVFLAVSVFMNPLSAAKMHLPIRLDLKVKVKQFCKEERIEDSKLLENINKVAVEQVEAIIKDAELGKIVEEELSDKLDSILTTPESKDFILQEAKKRAS